MQDVMFIKLENPSTYNTLFIENEDDNKYYGKVEVRENYFRSVELTQISPKLLKKDSVVYINTGDNKLDRITLLSNPRVEDNPNILVFNAKTFGDKKVLSRGVVSFKIFLENESINFYTLELK